MRAGGVNTQAENDIVALSGLPRQTFEHDPIDRNQEPTMKVKTIEQRKKMTRNVLEPSLDCPNGLDGKIKRASVPVKQEDLTGTNNLTLLVSKNRPNIKRLLHG